MSEVVGPNKKTIDMRVLQWAQCNKE